MPVVAVVMLLVTVLPASAQSIVDSSDAAIGSEKTRAVLTLVERHLHSSEFKITNLRIGRAGGVCGAVNVKNRMGAYTGSRGFVTDVTEGFFGRLPDAPELRHPASMHDYDAMVRAQALFAANCTTR